MITFITVTTHGAAWKDSETSLRRLANRWRRQGANEHTILVYRGKPLGPNDAVTIVDVACLLGVAGIILPVTESPTVNGRSEAFGVPVYFWSEQA